MTTKQRALLASACWFAALALFTFPSHDVDARQQAQTTRELAAEIERLSKRIILQQPPAALPCTYALSPATVQKVPAAGGPVAFTVTPTPDDVACSWGVLAPDAWAQPDVVDGAASGTVTVTVAANTATETRTSTLTIATVAGVIGQEAAAVETGRTVTTAAELTAALQAGGEIHVRPGYYVGNFRITKPTVLVGVDTLPIARVTQGATSAVTLAPTAAAATTTAAPVPQTPEPTTPDPTMPEGERRRPQPRPLMANDQTLEVSASDVTVRGITILSGNIDTSTVLIGDPDNRDVSTLPDRVLFDRVEVIADPAKGGLRGFDVHARGVTITRSRVTGYWYKGRDAQAILACNGPGPYVFEDNHLEGSGENIMFGGASIRTAAHHPKDAVVRGNTLFKPQGWRAIGATVKNSLECKACDGALFEGNTIDGNWTSGQTGSPIVLTPRNPYNDSPWNVVRNVIIRGNNTRNVPNGYMVQILYTDNSGSTQSTANITIEGNLHTGPAMIIVTGGLDGDLILRNNTGPMITHSVLYFNEQPKSKPRCVIERNVWRHGRYGILSQHAGQGYTTLNYYCASSTVMGNVIEESNGTTYYWGRWPKGSGELLPLGGLPPRLDPTTYKYLPGGAGY